MVDVPKKISELPPAQLPNEGDLYPVVQLADTRKQTLAQLRTAIGIGANVTALNGLTGAADKLAYFTGVGSMALTTLSSFMRTLLDDADAATARGTLGVLNVTPGFIDGLQLQWVSANAVTVTAGAAMVNGSLLTAASPIATTGMVLSATTWYHAYLYSNAGVAAVEFVTTAPSAQTFGTARTKTGDVTRRYIASIRTAAANVIIRFVQSGGKVTYLADVTTAPLLLLNSGTAVVSTSVSAAATAPVTATHGTIMALNAASNAVTLYLANPDAGIAVSGSFHQMIIPQNGQLCSDFALGAAQTILYTYSGAPGASGAYIRIVGYLFER